MEKYINEETVVQDEIYSAFKDDVICPICSNILIEPHMCMNCQNTYCKKCIDEWSKKNNQCPNRCDNPDYRRSLEKNNTLSKLKFKCEKCGEQFEYNNMESHLTNCNPGVKIEKTTVNKDIKRKVKRLKRNEIKPAGKLPRIRCKKNIIKFYHFN